MIALQYSTFLCLALITVLVSWAAPRQLAFDFVAAWTAVVLFLLSPPTLAWLGLCSFGIPLVLQVTRTEIRGLVTALICALLVAGLVAARSLPALPWIGGAFFTLRALHITLDWWMGRMPSPDLRQSIRYFFFLPIIAAGPIGRYQHFQNQLRRRRWELSAFGRGFERLLLGTIFFFVVSGTGMTWVVAESAPYLDRLPRFFELWGEAALMWVDLFFAFAGTSHIALGIGLMCGIALEENFNRPWKAQSLLEFWTRWHMTLISWVKDYVYQPVVAMTREPVIGLLLAMLVIGLWHAFSVYYVLWAFWQSLGIMLSRLLKVRFGEGKLGRVLGPLSVLAWLSAARPVLDTIGVTF